MNRRRQYAVNDGSDKQLMREILSFTGGMPQWQMAAPEEHDVDGGREQRGAFEGAGPHHRPIDVDESDPLVASVFPCNDDLSATMELAPNRNGYFSRMMDDNVEGDFNTNSNTCPDLQSQAVQVGLAAPIARPNHKRSKKFSDQEDEVLVSAWLNVSLDPVVGKDQKGGRYWSRIYEYFNEHKPYQSQRTVNSLMHRWETIQKCVNKFCGCLTRIELRRRSGTTMQDKVAEGQRHVLYTSLRTNIRNHFNSCIAGISCEHNQNG